MSSEVKDLPPTSLSYSLSSNKMHKIQRLPTMSRLGKTWCSIVTIVLEKVVTPRLSKKKIHSTTSYAYLGPDWLVTAKTRLQDSKLLYFETTREDSKDTGVSKNRLFLYYISQFGWLNLPSKYINNSCAGKSCRVSLGSPKILSFINSVALHNKSSHMWPCSFI